MLGGMVIKPLFSPFVVPMVQLLMRLNAASAPLEAVSRPYNMFSGPIPAICVGQLMADLPVPVVGCRARQFDRQAYGIEIVFA